MQVLQSQQHLRQKVHDLRLGEGLLGAVYVLEQAAVVSVLHHHVQHAVLHKGSVVAGDVGMRHIRQHLDFVHHILLVLRVGLIDEYALDDIL